MSAVSKWRLLSEVCSGSLIVLVVDGDDDVGLVATSDGSKVWWRWESAVSEADVADEEFSQTLSMVKTWGVGRC